ncbi:PilZ domain-containing protein [Chloroflexota bacterium]
MSEIDQILEYLEYIRQQKRPVSLVNTYQGVSLSLEVEIQQILRKRKEVVVATNPGRPLSLLPATQIMIHSDLFPRPIQARVASVDVHHRTAVLRNCSFIQSEQDGRKETRVQPKFEINASLTIGGQNEMRGIINDLSIEGISLILMSNNIDLTEIYYPNTSVRINYNFAVTSDEDLVPMSVAAKVTYINAIDPMEKYRIGFITYPQEPQKDLLRRFIFDRQTEMFNELEQDSAPQRGSSVIL